MDNETAKLVMSALNSDEDYNATQDLAYLTAGLSPNDRFDAPTPEFTLAGKIRTKMYNVSLASEDRGDIPF